MALKPRIRRKIRRRSSPKPRARASASAHAQRADAKAQMQPEGAVMIGGAKDPAEQSADRMAASALSGQPAGGAAPATPGIHRSATAPTVAPGAKATKAPPAASQAVGQMGPGKPLSRAERRFFEPRFGQDFSNIRVHDDGPAHRAADAMEAEAFTSGQNIAFGQGARTSGGPALMAHELAHAAQPGATTRRKIKADKTTDLKTYLNTEYSATGLKASGKTLSSGSRKDAGDLEHQTAQNLLASARVFDVAGTTAQEIRDNLDTHILARTDIASFAKAIRLNFTPGTPQMEPALNKLIFDELEKRLKEIETMLREEGKTDTEISAELRRITNGMLISVFKDLAGTAAFEEQIQIIWQKSLEYDKRKTKGAADYASACFFASNLVFFGGSGGGIKREDVDVMPRDDAEMKTPAWTDWVTGDWGYIKNTGTSSPAPGQEGENIISVGDAKFWAHYDPSNPIVTLPEIFAEVKSWNKGALLKTYRKFPSNGLK